LTHEVKVD